MINVFIIGSKGLPAKYGGYETFVDNLTKRKKDEHIRYFVSCMGNTNSEFEYNNAHCFSIKLKKDNALGRVLNVHKSLVWVKKFLKHNVSSSDTNIIYILGCRIGILMPFYKRKIKKLNCIIACNPDGLEWKRDKWNKFEKKLVLYAEKQLVKNSNYVICDSINIKSYIEKTYKDIETGHISYLAYGCDVSLSSASEKQMVEWLKNNDISPRQYYLIIGRFVPENNYELMIREFMKSQTDKKLLIISNVQENAFYNKLIKDLHFEADKRIVFAGTLYDSELVKKIRENAFAYLHGHSVGGTNPSLLEAMASTKINLLYNVSFNKEVGAEQCLYFNDECGNLANLINYVENNYNILVKKLNPKSVVEQKYSWESIVNQYEQFFVEMSKKMKGIILAGGSGTRLYPLTKVTSKQLLPVYDKPMIYYPLSILMLAGIKDILIISTPEDTPKFKELLGNGDDFGIHLSYCVQPSPDGLAQAFILGEEFIGNDACAMILGDNIFYGDGLKKKLFASVERAEKDGIATVFGYYVKDPERFGVVEFNDHDEAISIEEKPLNPKSNYAVTGLYFYPKGVSKKAKTIKPSKRGELEITDLNKLFLKEKSLHVELLSRGVTWLDTGTHESLVDASLFVKTIEIKMGLMVSCPEEISYYNGWINAAKLIEIGNTMSKNDYGQHLLNVAAGKIKNH